MNELKNSSTSNLYQSLNPWVLLLVTLGVTMVGFQFIGAFLGILIALPFYPDGLAEFLTSVMDPTSHPAMRMPLLIMQGVGSFTGFILMPWILIKFFYKGSLEDFSGPQINGLLILLVLFITIFFMGVNAPFIDWNQHVQLPEFMAGLEQKLRTMEEMLAQTSEFITQFQNPGQLIVGIIVVAIIPGIGEELVFRGLVQNHVYRISKNIHVAIWVGALLFSLFHLQFYGLVPRMFLGALFGYLYYFSGSIVYPMIAHFINNGFTLIMLYLYQNGKVEFDIESTEALPWPQIIVATVITFVFIAIFRKKALHEQLD